MEAKRTLVKSPPELWAELSDMAALARHLGEFGEIRITRTEPESVVEWEARACLRLRAAGAVRVGHDGHAHGAARDAGPAPARAGARARARAGPAARRASGRACSGAAGPSPRRPWPRHRPPLDPDPLPAIEAATGAAVLSNALDALGAAHHRPFSR